MEPNPPTDRAEFQELPAGTDSDNKISLPGLGCVLLAGAWAFLLIVEGSRIYLINPYYGVVRGGQPIAPPKAILAWFFGLSAVQVVLFVLGMSAVLRRRGTQAIQWAAGLIGVIVLMYVGMLFLAEPRAIP